MPLFDHFHPPLSRERHWESFHGTWAGSIADALNRILPRGYFAEELTHAGAGTEIDVATTFEVRVYSSSGGPTLVAAIELVSPANKDRPDSRRAFATKCAGYLSQGIAVVVADVITEQHGNLHNEILGQLSATTGLLPQTAHLYASAYRPVRRDEREEVEVWAAELALGVALPTLPLWVNAGTPLPLDFEAAYTDACRRRRIEIP